MIRVAPTVIPGEDGESNDSLMQFNFYGSRRGLRPFRGLLPPWPAADGLRHLAGWRLSSARRLDQRRLVLYQWVCPMTGLDPLRTFAPDLCSYAASKSLILLGVATLCVNLADRVKTPCRTAMSIVRIRQASLATHTCRKAAGGESILRVFRALLSFHTICLRFAPSHPYGAVNNPIRLRGCIRRPFGVVALPRARAAALSSGDGSRVTG